ncbi:MAG: hypothetical protein COV29_03080 [Candidatus Yanofskybacteria bacterium CG10_big_fil_rev_8_21_14_0_10_36_16]|uniref:Uncharacterized protein n=1 Tax=Candidatus Yanofskybacteria bacterium CG10_big_fil_rev_8_21_14_0_10_36_16 TaxID=1975096 RepID=A0A2J0Q777_9BACT|nr:MAG: hypothetical protein COV29_03080 [Candidatus Yanofskybacteria bacterium CG10_big_fil_rev_8_21_14_0_10_36_16]
MEDFGKKKVLFVITQSEMGGAQKFLVNLTKKLDKNKYEVMVAAGPDGGGELFNILKRHNIKSFRLKNAKRNINLVKDVMEIFELRKLIKEFKPDVLFLNSSKTTLWGPKAVYFPTKIKPTPKIIYRIGGWSFNDPRPKWEKKLWILIEKTFAKYKDIIMVNNEHDLKQAKKLNINPKGKIELIYNGIDINEIEFLSREESRNELVLSNEDFVVGTIANFYPTKGLKYLIDAVAILNNSYFISDIKFIIIGDGPDRKTQEARINNEELSKQIILAGRKENAYKYLLAFDLFVLPSVKEGFSWAMLEAMAAKLPIVATRVGATPEIIQSNRNGLLINPANPKELAEAIKNIKGSEQLRRDLGDKAFQTVISRFTLDKMISQIEKLL